MTVAFHGKHKEIDEESAAVETVTLHCYMHNYSFMVDDTLEPEWAPDWCKRTESVLIDTFVTNPASTGWVQHADWLLCPGCEERWQKKFAPIDIAGLMGGRKQS